MSRPAIAAALAREDLAGGERLVAFSLASFAGRDGRAWPGAPAAAARAGLSRSRYLYGRDQLARRGLIVIEEMASGRGRASTVALRFAADGPWWEGEINAELFEAVLSRTRTRGPARLLLAAMAALADPDGVIRGVTNDEVYAAAGVTAPSWRRAPGAARVGRVGVVERRPRAREHERLAGATVGGDSRAAIGPRPRRAAWFSGPGEAAARSGRGYGRR